MFQIYSVYDAGVRGFSDGLVYLLANTSLKDEAVWIYVVEATGEYGRVILTNENLLEKELKKLYHSGNPEAEPPKWIKLEEWMLANCPTGYLKISQVNFEQRLKYIFLATWAISLVLMLPLPHTIQFIVATLLALNSFVIGYLIHLDGKYRAVCFIYAVVTIIWPFLPL